MATIASNIQQVRPQMATACLAAGRPEQSVTLLVVSKTFGPEAVRAAFEAGERHFGENYVQEALEKIAALADLRAQITWHLIGPLQSNKTRVVAENFDWVHAVDRLKTAERLSAQRPAHLQPMQVCLQVNISHEPHKHGFAPEEVLQAAQYVARLPHLRLRGLMSIPEPSIDPALHAAPHRALRGLFDRLRHEGLALDTLSMGMSADLAPAIDQGSTMVRVGSAIFGSRLPTPSEAP